jgi:hypothetical protein
VKQEHADQLAHLMFLGSTLYLLGRLVAHESEDWTDGIMRLLAPPAPAPAVERPPAKVIPFPRRGRRS